MGIKESETVGIIIQILNSVKTLPSELGSKHLNITTLWVPFSLVTFWFISFLPSVPLAYNPGQKSVLDTGSDQWI